MVLERKKSALYFLKYGVKRVRHETGRVVQFISDMYISLEKIIKNNKTKAKKQEQRKGES